MGTPKPRAGFPKMEKHAAATYVACSLLLVGCAWFTKDTLFQTPKVTTQDLLGTGKRFSMEDSSERTGTASAANAILRRAQSTLPKKRLRTQITRSITRGSTTR